MSITPEQLEELEKKLSSVQNPTYSVAELCSFDELVNQLMPSLIAAARDLEEIKSGKCAKWTIEVEKDRDQWKERAERIESVRHQRDVQGRNGNWNYDPYMHGIFNGLECAMSTLEDRAPEYKSAPTEWLGDRAASYQATFSAPPGCDFPDPPIDDAPTA